MNKQDVIAFFDQWAPKWDEQQTYDEKKINEILDYANIKKGMVILDVACGTGVLFSAYLQRDVAKIVGVDISSEMIKIARRKWIDSKIQLVQADAEEADFKETFDSIVIYNAFPHFQNPQKLLGHLSFYLKPEGRITVAHGAAREEIDAHHRGVAKNVSMGLMKAEELAKIMNRGLFVDAVISDEEKYIVSGHKV